MPDQFDASPTEKTHKGDLYTNAIFVFETVHYHYLFNSPWSGVEPKGAPGVTFTSQKRLTLAGKVQSQMPYLNLLDTPQ